MIRSLACCLVTLTVAASCTSDSVNAPANQVTVCHMDGNRGTLTQIDVGALSLHKSHGDYVAALSVDPKNTPGDSIHFTRVTDAVNSIRAGRISRGELTAAACRVTVAVASGTYPGSAAESQNPGFEKFPIVIDVPDITISGATVMTVSSTGRAAGISTTSPASAFAPSPALIVEGGSSSQQGVSQEIFLVNGHPAGSRGDNAVIEGFVFQTGRSLTDTITGGQGVLSMRVNGIVVRGNRFEGGFTESIDLRASSGTVEKNYLTGPGNACDICIAGPGNFVVRDNNLSGPGGIPGILIVPATVLPVPSIMEQYTLPAASTVTVSVTNNAVIGHLARPVGAGVRVGALGIGAPTVVGTNKVTISDNLLDSNTFGMIVEAAFPVASGSLRGDIDVTTSGNTVTRSCQNSLLVSFSRHTTGLGLTNQPYLRNTTYNLALGSDFSWDNAWYADPPGLGNTLLVNGQTIANGTRVLYDATRICSLNP